MSEQAIDNGVEVGINRSDTDLKTVFVGFRRDVWEQFHEIHHRLDCMDATIQSVNAKCDALEIAVAALTAKRGTGE